VGGKKRREISFVSDKVQWRIFVNMVRTFVSKQKWGLEEKTNNMH
jgi:hypothetical protein